MPICFAAIWLGAAQTVAAIALSGQPGKTVRNWNVCDA
jgi:hypothetical protein